MSRPDPAGGGDLGDLVAALVDLPSVSGSERDLADVVERRLQNHAYLQVERDGDALVARTALGRPGRVLLAGHLDTVPVAGNLPSRRVDGRLFGCGSSDMKAALAVMLTLADEVTEPVNDVTYVFYDNEEVAADRNGLGRLARAHPEWLAADLAVLMEPTDGVVEAGCQGTLRAVVTLPGVRAHSARAWLGSNAIHAAAPVLERLRSYQARTVDIDGCRYREGLSAVRIEGGVAGNVIPDACTVTVNFRFAPDRTEKAAFEHVREVLGVEQLRLTDSAPGALPGLDAEPVRDFLRLVGAGVRAKLGWTDVSRFAALGIPALNYGPGDPNLAHTAGESVDLAQVQRCADLLTGWLAGRAPQPTQPG